MTSPTSTSASAASTFTGSTSSPRGRYLWHELMVPDVDAALRFYPDVTGWTTSAMAPAEGMPLYHMFNNGGAPVAGLMALPEAEAKKGVPPHWLPYVGTDDVDATKKEALSLGATELLPPTDIPNVGRIAVLRDPQGAAFALFKPNMASTAETAPKTGEVSWHDLATTDIDAAVDFYSRLFGWKKTTAMDMGADGTYQMFGRGDFTYGGIYKRGPNVPASSWLGYIQVADLDKSCEAVKKNGGKILNGPHEVPGGDRIVTCLDNQGAHFALHGKKPA